MDRASQGDQMRLSPEQLSRFTKICESINNIDDSYWPKYFTKKKLTDFIFEYLNNNPKDSIERVVSGAFGILYDRLDEEQQQEFRNNSNLIFQILWGKLEQLKFIDSNKLPPIISDHREDPELAFRTGAAPSSSPTRFLETNPVTKPLDFSLKPDDNSQNKPN